MQLKKPKSAAEDELLKLINEGYSTRRTIHEEYDRKMGSAHLWSLYIREWRRRASDSLIAIFPDRLEADTFENTAELFPYGLYEGNIDMVHSNAEKLINKSIQTLSEFKDNRLGRYAGVTQQDNKREPLPEQLSRNEIPAEKLPTPISKNVLSYQDTTNAVQMRNIDVLLVTATEVETRAVLNLFPNPQLHHIGEQTYHNLGVIKGAKIFMVQSEMGPGGPSGATLTIEEGIRLLNPTAVIMVGIAFGISEGKQNIGDVLVSKQLIQYELQRVGTDSNNKHAILHLRDDRPSASPRMLQRFRAAANYWQASSTVKFGFILSGAKLVDNQDFRDQLLILAPEAIGGEMEASGLYAVAQRKKVDWIVVKAICDWADGNKHQDKEQRQQLAAENAARFAVYVLEQGGFERLEQAEMPLSDATNSDKPEPRSAEQHLNDLKRRVELAQKRTSEQGQQGNNDQTIQEITNDTIDAIRKSLM